MGGAKNMKKPSLLKHLVLFQEIIQLRSSKYGLVIFKHLIYIGRHRLDDL